MKFCKICKYELEETAVVGGTIWCEYCSQLGEVTVVQDECYSCTLKKHEKTNHVQIDIS